MAQPATTADGPLLAGLPSLVDYAVSLAQRQRERDSLAIVVYHLIGDLVNASRHALIHYWPLERTGPVFEQTHFASPYVKWATITNEDFQRVDRCLQRLLEPMWHGYARMTWPQSSAEFNDPYRSRGIESRKDAWFLFDGVKRRYTCCRIDVGTPVIETAAIEAGGAVDESGWVRNHWNRRSRPDDERFKIVTFSKHDIAERRIILEMQAVGLERVERMNAARAEFALWLRSNYSLEDVTAVHKGTLDN
jgi:hypothetical protein